MNNKGKKEQQCKDAHMQTRDNIERIYICLFIPYYKYLGTKNKKEELN